MKHSLTSGSIWRGMLFFALPILLGNIFQQLYNTADAFIVGRFLDKNAYAAVSSSGSLIFLLVGFFNGIAVGAGVVIARYYGAKDNEKLQTAVHTTLAFGLTAGIVLTVLGMTLTPQLLRLMKTDTDVLPNSIDYFRMYFAGSIAIVMYNLCVGILQAVGDSRHPLYYLILSSLVNIALDLLFVGVFHWGVWSAALATSISQFVSLGLCIFRLCHYDTVYRVRLRKIRFHLPMLKQVIHFGLPSGVQNSIIAFANVIVQSNINAFGSNAMAGCGTYAKLEGFAFLPITCFTMALTTFVSQNLGAHQYERVKKGVRFGIVCSTTLAECIGVVLFLLAEPLVAIFQNDPAVIEIGVRQAHVEALEMGADYAINGREEDTLARVMELTGGMGAHIVFETAGNRVTAAQTESLTRRGGTIVIVGNVMGDTPMNFYKIAHKELVIKTVHRYRNVFPLAIQAISDGKIDIEKIASDCFDFDNGIAAFEKSLCEKQAVVKAILKME